MTESTRRTKGLRQGPRGSKVLEGVRSAVLAELVRAGYAGVTVEAVARIAEVNRTTIYRRWPSKPDLIAAAIEPLLERYAEDRDTGTLRGDLLALMLAIRRNETSLEGRALRSAFGSATPELQALATDANERILASFRRIFERGRIRGEVRDDDDTDTLSYLAYAGLVFWEQTRSRPPSDYDCRRVVEILVRSATSS